MAKVARVAEGAEEEGVAEAQVSDRQFCSNISNLIQGISFWFPPLILSIWLFWFQKIQQNFVLISTQVVDSKVGGEETVAGVALLAAIPGEAVMSAGHGGIHSSWPWESLQHSLLLPFCISASACQNSWKAAAGSLLKVRTTQPVNR